MKEVLKYRSKSTRINDVTKNHSQTNAEVDYYPFPHRDSETHALQNGNLETLCICGRMLLGITEDVNKYAKQRINSIHHVHPWNSQGSIEASLDSVKKNSYGKIVEPYLEDEQCQMRMQEQGYTQSDREEFDREANEKRIYVASSTERAYCRD